MTSDAGDAAAASVVSLMLLATAFLAYWVPTAVAFARGHHQRAPIALVNLFFGWTGIGWIAALIWAASAKVRR